MSWVIIQELTGKQFIGKLNSKVKIGRSHIKLHDILELNRLYEVSNGEVRPFTQETPEEEPFTGGNSSFFDTNSAQSLTTEEIQKLKEEKGG